LASAPAAPKVAAPKAAAAPVAPAASAPPVAAPKAAAPAGGERVIASPLAKRMAAQAGLALTGVSGSGPNGRIIKADVEAALSGGRPAIAAAAPAATAPSRPTAPVQPGAAYVEVPTTNMRRVIARRLTEAKQQVPHFYLTLDCEIDRLLKMREELNGRGEKEGFKLSVNDFVIRASALALRKVPAANASWTDKAILQYTSVDISIAVALEAGLITPIIRHADQKGLAQISNEMKELAKRAREGKLAPEDYQGGTFSISNLGMFGIRQFDAVINPPQGAILAVGAGEQRPVVKQGALAIATVMTCTLSCDHRVVDGALGAKLLGAIKGYIEDPVTMLL
jgi:pyruvate dehydrogenase E2 component (dihydrolipoamide acetyltransferase)